MGKPVKARALKGSSLRADVLSRQGVKINKRARLGHTGHFGKVMEVPIERKKKGGEGGEEGGGGRKFGAGEEGGSKKKNRSRFNKFKHAGQGDEDAAEGGGADSGQSSKDTIDAAGAGDDGGAAGDRTERLPGESFCKFMKRLNRETREKLNVQAAKAAKVSTKRKDHMAKRKENMKDKKDLKALKSMTPRDDDGVGLAGKDLIEHKLRAEERSHVKFGEQADRPPLIKLSTPLKGIKKANPLDAKGYVHGGVPLIPEVSRESQSRREMEMLRKNAVANYRSIVQNKRMEKGLTSIGQI